MTHRGIQHSIRQRRRQDESGQAVVETLIVVPLVVFFMLGVLQLSMIQHARIMTDYAAFNAARAGIVWNADRIIMENAAIISLLPTNEALFEESALGNPMAMLKAILKRALLFQINRALPAAINVIRTGANNFLSQAPGIIGEGLTSANDALMNAATNAAVQAGNNWVAQNLADAGQMVRVDIYSPRGGIFGDLLTGQGLEGTAQGAITGAMCGGLAGAVTGALTGGWGIDGEIEFDDPENCAGTLLSIRVRYMYMMKIPFANWVIHSAWAAAQAGRKLYGAVWNPQTAVGETGFRDVDSQGQPVPSSIEAQEDQLASQDLEATSNFAAQGVFLVPLTATYSMRMQSNPYLLSISL